MYILSKRELLKTRIDHSKFRELYTLTNMRIMIKSHVLLIMIRLYQKALTPHGGSVTQNTHINTK